MLFRLGIILCTTLNPFCFFFYFPCSTPLPNLRFLASALFLFCSSSCFHKHAPWINDYSEEREDFGGGPLFLGKNAIRGRMRNRMKRDRLTDRGEKGFSSTAEDFYVSNLCTRARGPGIKGKRIETKEERMRPTKWRGRRARYNFCDCRGHLCVAVDLHRPTIFSSHSSCIFSFSQSFPSFLSVFPLFSQASSYTRSRLETANTKQFLSPLLPFPHIICLYRNESIHDINQSAKCNLMYKRDRVRAPVPWIYFKLLLLSPIQYIYI